MRKNKTTKIIALIVSLVMVAVSCIFSPAILSFAEDVLGGGQGKNQDENSSLSQMKGDYAAPYNLENYGCAEGISTIDTEKNFANYSNVSIDKVGVDDSFALKIDGSSADCAYVKIGEAKSVLKKNTTYIVSMKLKKSGTINSFNMGVHIQQGNKMAEADVLGDAQIKEDEWTEYSFEFKPNTANITAWSHLYFNWDIAENSSLYIDDYSVVKKGDSAAANMTPNGNFDRSIYIDGTIDGSLVENANYGTKVPDGMEGFTVLSGTGFKGSIAAKLERTQANIDSGKLDTATFSFEEKGAFENNTKYIVEFKAKKTADITLLNVLLREKSAEHTVISLGKAALDGYFSNSDYVLYRLEYVTDGTASDGQSHISFAIDGAVGSHIVFDDIKIYKADDAEQNSVLPNGSFDVMRIASNSEADWKTVQIPYVIEDYDCISNYSNERSHLPVLATKYGAVAIEKCGEDDTYALKINGESKATETYVKIGNAINQLKGETEYELTMSVKKKGDVSSFSTGIVYDWKYFEENFTADVEDDWKQISFKVTPKNNTEGNTGWNHIILKWNVPTGSELYIDNISIVATNDESKKEVFKKGAFDATAHEESIVDERIEKETLYAPKYLESVPTNGEVVENEGFKGSYGFKMVGTGTRTTAKIRYDSRPGVQNYTEYYIEFKAKRNGNISFFSAGMQEQWSNHDALIFGNEAVVSEHISDNFYNYYRIKYTTDGNALGTDGKGAWTYITFTYNGEAGSSLVIDDIKVYPTEGENPTETFKKGDFDLVYQELEIAEKEDVVYVPRKIEEYTSRHNFYVEGTKAEIDPTLSIAENEGVNGSAAFRIEGTGSTKAIKISANSLSELTNNSLYKVGIKVKIKSDTGVKANADTFFRYGVVERWTKHYTLNFKGEKFSKCITEDYHYYQSLYTTDNSCDGAWSYLIFSYNIPVGMSLYIDDIEMIPVDDKAMWISDKEGNAVNLFRKSTFDMVDLGQDKLNASETKPQDVTPKLKYSYSSLKPYTIAVDDAPSGGYCLAFGFSETEALNGEHMMQMIPSMPGEVYKISFWVKVIGEANGAFYISDGKWLNHTYGYDFNQYETGKWTKVELIYHDRTTAYTASTYRRLRFEFNGAAGSGMLIDNISCVRIDCDYESFNIFGGGNGDFEASEIYPEIAWDENDRFIYKEDK